MCGVLVCVCVVCVCWCVCWCVCGPDDRPPPDRPKFRSFFPLPLLFSLFFSLWGSSRVFFFSLSLSGGLLVSFFSLSLWVSSRGILSHDSPRAKTRTFEGPGRPKHHQNSTRRPPERKKRKWRREREKKSDILGLPPFGPHPSGLHKTGPHSDGPNLVTKAGLSRPGPNSVAPVFSLHCTDILSTLVHRVQQKKLIVHFCNGKTNNAVCQSKSLKDLEIENNLRLFGKLCPQSYMTSSPRRR